MTSDEYNNSRQFLDFFTTNSPDDQEFLNCLQNISREEIPNFQGLSSTFGRPSVVEHEYSTLSTIPYQPAIASKELSGTELDLYDNTKDNGAIPDSRGEKFRIENTLPDDIFTFANAPYRLMNDDGQSRHNPSGQSQGPFFGTRTELGFGSDSCFADHHYAPPPGATDVHVVEGRVLETLNSFEPSHSGANTQPPSSVASKKRRALSGKACSLLTNSKQPEQTYPKSEVVNNDEVNLQSSIAIPSESDPRKKARKGPKQPSPLASENPSRRKPRASETKRQNLSEKEKKENHIRSEQKRRNQIREGFASLLEMMPAGLADGSSNSKCIVLARAVEWLTELRDGNEKLRYQLNTLNP